MRIEFRDETREVPEHIAIWMREMQTFRLTYKEALTEVNRVMQADFINRAAERFIDGHFKQRRGGDW